MLEKKYLEEQETLLDFKNPHNVHPVYLEERIMKHGKDIINYVNRRGQKRTEHNSYRKPEIKLNVILSKVKRKLTYCPAKKT